MRRRALTAALALVCVAALVVSVPATAAPQGAIDGVSVTKDVRIPTRSGNLLRGNLYRPTIKGVPVDGRPTVVTYFPYVKDDASRFEIEGMTRFAREGYSGLLVDIPGTGASPGEFGFLSQREIADGRDAVEWAATQSFSNGRVGLWGYSYPGITAAHIAATRPPHLKAVVPASIFNDPYRDLVFPGGILTSQDGALLPFLTAYTIGRQRPDTDPAVAVDELIQSATHPGGPLALAEAPTHPFYDDYWKERALDGRIEKIQVPALLWGGWSDVYPRGTLLNRSAIGSKHARLVMGPWGHLAGASFEPLALFLDESVRWFDTFLRQDPSPERARAATGTRLFDTDWTSKERYAGTWPGRFTEHPSWPVAGQARTLSLCANAGSQPETGAPWPIQGRLAAGCATSGSLPVVHVPVEATGGGSIGHDAYANPYLNEVWDDKDQRSSLASTALVSEPFARATTLTGPMTAELSATTTGTDADWVVRVVDIGPAGTRVLAPGWLRASRRSEDPRRAYLWHTHDHSEPIVSDQPYRLKIEVWPTSYVLPAGHRLGLLVRTADTLKVTPTGAPGLSRILTGPDHPSTLSFTVAGSPGAARTAGPGTASPQPGRPGSLPATGGEAGLLPLGMVALLLGAAGLRLRTQAGSPRLLPR